MLSSRRDKSMGTFQAFRLALSQQCNVFFVFYFLFSPSPFLPVHFFFFNSIAQLIFSSLIIFRKQKTQKFRDCREIFLKLYLRRGQIMMMFEIEHFPELLRRNDLKDSIYPLLDKNKSPHISFLYPRVNSLQNAIGLVAIRERSEEILLAASSFNLKSKLYRPKLFCLQLAEEIRISLNIS